MRKALTTLMLLVAALGSVYAYDVPDVNELGIVHGPIFGNGWLDSTSSVLQTDYRISIIGADYEANGFGVGYNLDFSFPATFKVDGEDISPTVYNPVMFTGGLGVNYRFSFGELVSLSLGIGVSAGYGIGIFNDPTEDEAASYGLIRLSVYAATALRVRVMERLILKGGIRVTAPFYTCYSTPSFPSTAEATTYVSLFGIGIFPYFGISYIY